MAYTHTYTHTYSYTYTKTHTYVYTYTYNTLHDTHKNEYAHRHAHTLPIHIHTYIHTHVYICNNRGMCNILRKDTLWWQLSRWSMDTQVLWAMLPSHHWLWPAWHWAAVAGGMGGRVPCHKREDTLVDLRMFQDKILVLPPSMETQGYFTIKTTGRFAIKHWDLTKKHVDIMGLFYQQYLI